MIGRIYVELNMTLLHTKFTRFGFGFREEDFVHVCPIISLYKADNDTPGMGPVWTPGARVPGYIKRTTKHCYTQIMKALGIVVSEKKIFVCLSHCKSMGANDTRDGAIFDPRRMIRRTYVKLHITM